MSAAQKPLSQDEIAATWKGKSLASKLSEIMVEVDRIAKRGRNDFHKYDYATESDITSAIREHLASRHIIILPRVRKWSTQEKAGEEGKKGGLLAFVDMTFSIVDGESGETFECDWLGCGEDKGDKAVYKAFTGALKYFALKLFWIPTGDDPEREGKRKRERAEPETEQPQAQPQPGELAATGDAAEILTLAERLAQHYGAVDPSTVIYEASKFTDDHGKERGFSDPRTVRSQKWVRRVRDTLQRDIGKLEAVAEPGAAEAAELFR